MPDRACLSARVGRFTPESLLRDKSSMRDVPPAECRMLPVYALAQDGSGQSRGSVAAVGRSSSESHSEERCPRASTGRFASFARSRTRMKAKPSRQPALYAVARCRAARPAQRVRQVWRRCRAPTYVEVEKPRGVGSAQQTAERRRPRRYAGICLSLRTICQPTNACLLPAVPKLCRVTPVSARPRAYVVNMAACRPLCPWHVFHAVIPMSRAHAHAFVILQFTA